MIEKLNPKQKFTIRDSNARLNLWSGAVRSGKTIATDFRFIQAVLEPRHDLPPDAIDVMIGKTVTSLKRNVINPIIELVGSNNAKYYSGKLEFYLFDQVIHVVGANDERSEGKIRGSTIRKVLGDELTLWPEPFFKMLDTRLSLTQSQAFLTTNPGNPKHYLKVDYIDRVKELNMKYYHFKITDNKSLSPDYVDALMKNFSGTWYERFIEGRWVTAEGAIYDFFNEDEHTLVRFPKADYYVIGADYGVSNPTVFLLCGVNRNAHPQIWVEKEYHYDSVKEQKQKVNSEYAQDFLDFCEEHLGVYWRTLLRATYLDPSAESFQLELLKHGVSSVTEADNDVMNGITTTSVMLKAGKLALSAKDCKNTVDEIYSYSWDSKAQEKGLDEPLKKDDHCMDALRYAVQSEFGDEYVDICTLARK